MGMARQESLKSKTSVAVAAGPKDLAVGSASTETPGRGPGLGANRRRRSSVTSTGPGHSVWWKEVARPKRGMGPDREAGFSVRHSSTPHLSGVS